MHTPRRGIWLLTQPRSGASVRQAHTFLFFRQILFSEFADIFANSVTAYQQTGWTDELLSVCPRPGCGRS